MPSYTSSSSQLDTGSISLEGDRESSTAENSIREQIWSIRGPDRGPLATQVSQVRLKVISDLVRALGEVTVQVVRLARAMSLTANASLSTATHSCLMTIIFTQSDSSIAPNCDGFALGVMTDNVSVLIVLMLHGSCAWPRSFTAFSFVLEGSLLHRPAADIGS